MAPKRRHPKVGLKRMDAAIDALTPMGFPADLIRRKVKSLLKLYDGDYGWVFIEEAAYKLLIESILEDQEGLLCEQGETSCRDSQNENVCQDGFEGELLEAGPSSGAGKPLCSDKDKALAASIDDASVPSLVSVLEPTLTPPKNVKTWSNEVNATFLNQQKISVLSELDLLSAPPGFERLVPFSSDIVPKKRKPCLGWIGIKDENEFVLLEPLPVTGKSDVDRRRKRKSRWDEMPNALV